MVLAWNIGLISRPYSQPSADSVHLHFSPISCFYSVTADCFLVLRIRPNIYLETWSYFALPSDFKRRSVCLYWREKGLPRGLPQAADDNKFPAQRKAQMFEFSVLSSAFTRLAVPVVWTRSHSFSALPSLFLVNTSEVSCKELARDFLCLGLLWTLNHCTSP